MWVKFGYDPRTDPVSKVYQCLDVRVPKDVDVVETQSHAEAGTVDTYPNVTFFAGTKFRKTYSFETIFFYVQMGFCMLSFFPYLCLFSGQFWPW